MYRVNQQSLGLLVCACLLILPVLVSGRLRNHQDVLSVNPETSKKIVSPKSFPGRISLKRDGSIEKKINMFNFFSQQTAIRKKASSFIALSFNKQTQESYSIKVDNSFEEQARFFSLTSWLFFDNDDDSTRSQNRISLSNHANTFYTGMIGVGGDDDPQYKMIFDTGSTLIFLNSLKCGDIGCVRGNQYDSDDSDTYKPVDLNVEVQFGSGTIQGDMAIDTFYISDLVVERVEFIEITKEIGPIFESGSFDGLVGLAFPALGNNVDTLVDSMKEQNLIETKLISFYMSRVDESEDSFVTFGAIDDSLIDGEISYHKVANPLYWTILAEQILIGNTDTRLCSKSAPCPLAIDSGTSVIAGPTEALTKIMNIMEGMELSCDKIDTMPPITFVIDGKRYSLLGEEYIISTDGSIPNMYSHSDSPRQCEPALLTLDVQEEKYGSLWIIGDIFMSKYYTVFNRETKSVGFGKLKSIDPLLYQADIEVGAK